MNLIKNPEFDKKIIATNFSRAAKDYNKMALVQAHSAQKLCALALPFIKNNSTILDLGCGNGFVSKNLSSQKNLKIFESDLSLEMLKQSCGDKKICCDFENLPFKNHSFDILISSFSLQWLNNFEKNFQQFSLKLKSNGILAFCLPTDQSLEQLKIASANSGCNFHFNSLPTINDLKSALKNCGLVEKIFELEVIESEFISGREALQSIKKIGANYSNKKNFVSKTQLAQFDSFCLKNFINVNKKIFVTWRVAFFVCKNI
ncbi:MAG: methyltransferase domain-containing protein [Rickettsiales bacterium]|nr:methyltransferase domain-containing protein [Rickettsiales bacterium]